MFSAGAGTQDREAKIFTVSELNHAAQRTLEQTFANIWVEGEVSNFRGASSSGHCYFCIKDEFAQIDVVAFRSVMNNLRFKLADGLKILVAGRISLYTQRGRYQLVASAVEPRGAGALQLAFEQLKKKLAAEGLFDEARKRPIPALPQRIGIVTSPTGAAIKDILTVINRRFANVQILIYPCKVQGDGSKEEIAAGVRYLNENHPELDVLLIGRGGGSIEDLWAFNEEVVARAIAASTIPTISCVGHEIDFTIADFVADLRAPTPSAAAEIVVKNKAELQNTLKSLMARIAQNTQGALESLEQQLKGLARSMPFSKPKSMFEAQSQELDYQLEKIQNAFTVHLTEQRNRVKLLGSKIAILSPQNKLIEREKWLAPQAGRLANAFAKKWRNLEDALKISAGQLEALSPLAVLSRGYSIAFAEAGNQILKSASQVKKNDAIRIRLHEGEIKANVTEATEKN